MVNVEYKGNRESFNDNISGHEIIKQMKLSNIITIHDGQNYYSFDEIFSDCTISLLEWEDDLSKSVFWHSSAHLLASAIIKLYPEIKLGTGPAIDNGFYYDIDAGDIVIDAEKLKNIENEMINIAKNAYHFTKRNISKSEAKKLFANNPYKLEIIESLNDGEISIYQHGDFVDLCRGPHITSTDQVKSIKLTNISASYWRGDCKNKQMTRIYGVSFPNEAFLKEYLFIQEEAKKRDHQKIGVDLKLFTFSEKVGIGLPLWLPRGTVIRDQLEKFLRKAQVEAGYKQVVTPHIGHKNLYVTSGHYEKYGKDSFQPIMTPDKNNEYLLKPMSCPHHCEIYKSQPRSYRDLPLRLAEFGTVYRYEQHGELHGLARTRSFTQDDAHIFCRPDQVQSEINNVIDLVKKVFNKLEINSFTARLSFRDKNHLDKYIGDSKSWDEAENALETVAINAGLSVVKAYGEAAFYGPKIDFIIKDAIGRKWQLGTIQLDYQLPNRFDLNYIGQDNQEHRVVMIHRAPFGSFERFIAILLESTAGKLPFWLAPDQVAILPISDKYMDQAIELNNKLKSLEFRSIIDERNEKIGKKIRDTEMLKIPYMIIIGEQEVLTGLYSLRQQGQGDIGKMSLDNIVNLFISNLK